jgi:hypothetical protein
MNDRFINTSLVLSQQLISKKHRLYEKGEFVYCPLMRSGILNASNNSLYCATIAEKIRDRSIRVRKYEVSHFLG